MLTLSRKHRPVKSKPPRPFGVGILAPVLAQWSEGRHQFVLTEPEGPIGRYELEIHRDGRLVKVHGIDGAYYRDTARLYAELAVEADRLEQAEALEFAVAFMHSQGRLAALAGGPAPIVGGAPAPPRPVPAEPAPEAFVPRPVRRMVPDPR